MISSLLVAVLMVAVLALLKLSLHAQRQVAGPGTGRTPDLVQRAGSAAVETVSSRSVLSSPRGKAPVPFRWPADSHLRQQTIADWHRTYGARRHPIQVPGRSLRIDYPGGTASVLGKCSAVSSQPPHFAFCSGWHRQHRTETGRVPCDGSV